MDKQITIAANEAEFDRTAAWRVIGEMLANPHAVIGLSTGKTTKNLHLIIGEIYKLYPFDVSNITIFGVDEVTNVPRDYAGACYTMLKTQLIDTLGIKEENFLMPPSQSNDFHKECKLFQQAIEDRGGIDLQVLGLGINGHLGFNQPGTPFESETWVSHMDELLEARIRKELQTPPSQKLGGLTLGIKNIMQARKVILAAKGQSKADIVKQMLYGPVTPYIPASILQLHQNCEFILDSESAKHIR